ncbi:MAG TPA: 5'/3'-nucleotidase SurE [Thermoleophilia bacterium]|nr:5'/3'-nucleotidase SurE [Thermoleophilia bacterium]
MMSTEHPLVHLPRSGLTILLTNDDGIDSPGLFAVKRALDPLGDVHVIAPDRNRTGAARSITMRAPLWVEERILPDGSMGHSTDGTPVDCVRLAALGFLERRPDLIVSGINLSGNLGDDITYSGTVAAAFEGIMLGIPSLAVSADGYHDGYDLSVPARVSRLVVESILEKGFPAEALLNINCPDLDWEALSGIRLTTLGKRIYGDRVQLQESRGSRRRYFVYGDDLDYHNEVGTDFEAVGGGFVSVTPIHFHLTAHDVLRRMEDWRLDLADAVTEPAAGAWAFPGEGRERAEPGDAGIPGSHAESGGDAEPGDAAPAVGDAAMGRAAETATGNETADETAYETAASSSSPSLSPLEPAPRVVMFDLDGTVLDSVELIVDSFEHAILTVLGYRSTREDAVHNVGRPLLEQMESFDEVRAQELVDAYRDYNHREHDRRVRLYPGMADLLLRLRARGVRLALVTSKSRHTTEMAFRVTGVGELFEAVVCAGETTYHKPHAEPLLRALDSLGAAPESAVYVGDSPYDLQAATAAGLRSVGVAWGVFPEGDLAAESPDRMVRTMAQLEVVLSGSDTLTGDS